MMTGERVMWRDHPHSDAHALFRYDADGNAIVTVRATTLEGIDAADRFLRMLRERYPEAR